MRFFPVKYSFLRGGSDTHKPPMVLLYLILQEQNNEKGKHLRHRILFN